MPKRMRDQSDLEALIIRHSPRRKRHRLFEEEEAAQYLLGDGGPLLDQNIGMDDLDPAFPDYNVANLFNAYFRDGDSEDNTLDYWTIEGDYLTVEDCAASPGGICLVYAPTGEVSLSDYLISGMVPIGPGLDMGAVVAVGNQTSGDIYIQAQIRWYDEEQNLIATTTGKAKKVDKKVLRWLKIPRSKAAQSASFCSLVLYFYATGEGVVSIFGAGLYPLTPSDSTPGDAGETSDVTPISPGQAMGLYLYDDFDRSNVSPGGDDIGAILAGADSGAPWQGATYWLTAEGAGQTADDGLLGIQSSQAYGFDDTGSPHVYSAWQVGSTWKRAGRDIEVIATSAGLTRDSYSEGVSYCTLPLPDGCDVAGRHLIAWVNSYPYTDFYDEMIAAGWTKLLPTSGSTWFFKRLGGEDGDGATGYPATGAEDSLELPDYTGGYPAPWDEASTPDFTAFVFLIEAAYDEGSDNPGLWWQGGGYASSVEPPDFADPSYVDGEFQHLYLTAITSTEEITAGPEFADGFVYDENLGDNFPIASRADYAEVDEKPPEDSGTYATEADMSDWWLNSTSLVLRGGGWTATSGFVVEEDYPEGPHNVPHIALFHYEFVNDSNGHVTEYGWKGSTDEGIDQSGGVTIDQDNGTTSINLKGQTPWVRSTPLSGSTKYFVLLDMLNGVQKVKIWPADEAMPASWESTYAVQSGDADPAHLYLQTEFNDLGAVWVDDMWIGLGADEGTTGRVYIGIADGTSTSYFSPLPWGAAGPKVYVDGFLTILKSYSSSDWSFEFDRAPSYGARIEVEV